MNFSDEWKSLWPISSTFSAPLLLSDQTPTQSQQEQIGPLIFNPVPESLSHLTTSPSLYTPIPSLFPHLSVSRFLETSDGSVLPSTSSSISANFGPQISRTPLPQNALQLLHCPGASSVFAFYPTGSNADQVGFVLLTVQEDGHLGVKVSGEGNALNHRIVKLLVRPVNDPVFVAGNSCCFAIVGYLLVCTMYTVSWYCVRVSGLESGKVDFLGSKLFRSSSVVDACWSPHLEEECVVLLGSGDLFMFDLGDCSGASGFGTSFKGKKLSVVWSDEIVPEKGSWVGCEFSWHPRILIVAHSGAVFLVDSRSERSSLSCLLRIDMLVIGNAVENDRFVALSRAVSDGFHVVVASNRLLLLCDVRKPLMPVLRWAHNIAKPRFITVFRLSELRSHAKNDKYTWASESGYCILLGSFWNCEFSLFCYGPDTRKSVASEISKFCNSYYAWECPSEFSLSTHHCYCGSCILREEFSKDALPEWIDWQQKKDIVLGFGIIDKDLSVQLSEPDNYGGFTLIRLLSSGKLELQRYFASWDLVNFSEKAHNESSFLFEESLLYATGDAEYKLPKKFQYLKLNYLLRYLHNKLDEIIVNKKKETLENSTDMCSSNSDFHQNICKKLKACGISKFRSLPAISSLVRDINSPMSIMEIAVMDTWASLPPVLLRMSFVSYLELVDILIKQKNVSLEFLDVPDQPHLPPFTLRNPSHRSNMWSRKQQPGNSFVGPVVPLQFLVTFNKLYMEGKIVEVLADSELELQCSRVLHMINEEVTIADSVSKRHADHAVSLADDCDHTVSLADDTDDILPCSQKRDHFSLYEPVACSSKSLRDPTPESSTNQNKNYFKIVHTKGGLGEVASNDKLDKLGPEVLDTICPTGLRFYHRPIDPLPNEFKYFIGQQKKFQESFTVSRSNFQNHSM